MGFFFLSFFFSLLSLAQILLLAVRVKESINPISKSNKKMKEKHSQNEWLQIGSVMSMPSVFLYWSWLSCNFKAAFWFYISSITLETFQNFYRHIWNVGFDLFKKKRKVVFTCCECKNCVRVIKFPHNSFNSSFSST